MDGGSIVKAPVVTYQRKISLLTPHLLDARFLCANDKYIQHIFEPYTGHACSVESVNPWFTHVKIINLLCLNHVPHPFDPNRQTEPVSTARQSPDSLHILPQTI